MDPNSFDRDTGELDAWFAGAVAEHRGCSTATASTWAVVDAVTGFPVESNSGLSPQFSIRELLQFEKDQQEGKIEEKLKELRKPPRNMAPHNLLRRAFGFEDLDLEEGAE